MPGKRYMPAAERLVSIEFSAADDVARVYTAQRPWITRLKKNPAAVLIDEGREGSTPWAVFQVPKELISVRRKRRETRPLSPEERAERKARLTPGRTGVRDKKRRKRRSEP